MRVSAVQEGAGGWCTYVDAGLDLGGAALAQQLAWLYGVGDVPGRVEVVFVPLGGGAGGGEEGGQAEQQGGAADGEEEVHGGMCWWDFVEIWTGWTGLWSCLVRLQSTLDL